MWSRELCYEPTNIEELKDNHFDNSDQTRYFEHAREKNTKLSTDAIHEIIEEIRGRKIGFKEISIKYECSISNVNMIKNNIEYYSKSQKRSNEFKVCPRDRKNLIKTIINFKSNWLTPYNVCDIQKDINKNIGKMYPKHLLRN